jgi:putative DNA primase/helicase
MTGKMTVDGREERDESDPRWNDTSVEHSTMADAATVARALGGKRNGEGFLCHCPVPSHGKRQGDRNPSLSVRDGDSALLVHWFASCDRLDVLDALRRRGLLDVRVDAHSLRTVIHPASHEPDPTALDVWKAAVSAEGSIVETYLRSRNISLDVPLSLRCGRVMRPDRHLALAMIAAVQAPTGKIVAVQSTFLTRRGCKAAVAVPRIAIGALGAGAVRFGKPEGVLGLAEGIETALSAQQLTGVPTWACLGASRMHRVAIPDHVRELHLFGDNDDPGRDAVQRAAYENRERRVLPRFPSDNYKDWNDFADTM